MIALASRKPRHPLVCWVEETGDLKAHLGITTFCGNVLNLEEC